jgi:hypothetical protein
VGGLPRGGGVFNGHRTERGFGIDQGQAIGYGRAGAEDLSDQMQKRADAVLRAQEPRHLEIAARCAGGRAEQRHERRVVIGQPVAVEPWREAQRRGQAMKICIR